MNLPIFETHIQQAYLKWLSFQYPLVFKLTFSFANAGKRSPRTGRRMVREGMKKGICDIGIFYPAYPYHGLFIEFKRKGGKVSNAQKRVIELLNDNGYLAIVCDTIEDAISATKKYLNVHQQR